MPRWLVGTFALLLALGWWLAHRNSAPLAAMTGAGGASKACRSLMVPKTLEGAVQSEQATPPFRVGDAMLTPLAAFSVAGRVLGREDYHFDHGSAWSPTDLALGWGPMAAPGMAERLNVSQGARFYLYRWGSEGPPMSPDEIVRNSSNMHMVPADKAAADALSRVRAGEQVRIDGWLLRIDGDDGSTWQSSLSRDDSGDGACELVLVCTLERKP